MSLDFTHEEACYLHAAILSHYEVIMHADKTTRKKAADALDSAYVKLQEYIGGMKK